MAKDNVPFSPDPNAKLFSPQYVTLLFMSLFQNACFGSFFLFPLFVLKIGGSKSDIGILMGVTSLAAVFLRPWISVAVDRYGRKRSYGFGSLVMAIVGGLHIFYQQDIETTFLYLAVLRFFFGIAFAVCIVASFTLAGDLSPPHRLNEGIGIFGSAAMVGLALGPLITEWLVSQFDFSAMFIWIFGLGLMTFFCIFLLNEVHVQQTESQSVSFFDVLKHPTVLRMGLVTIFFGSVFSAHGAFVSPFAASKGLLVSTYFLSYSFVAALSRLFVGKVVDRLGEKRTLPITFVTVAVGFCVLIYVKTLFGLIVVGALIGLGHGILIPGLLAITVRAVPPQNLGKAIGFVTGGFDAGLFLGAVLLGFVGEHFGFSAIFSIASIIILLGLILFLLPQKPSGD